MINDLRMGVYRHYKGALYQVIGLAYDANADDLLEATSTRGDGVPFPNHERTVVVYFALQYDDAHLAPVRASLFVRTLEDFTAVVHDDSTPCDGTHCLHGETQVSRFTYLGPVLTGEMIT